MDPCNFSSLGNLRYAQNMNIHPPSHALVLGGSGNTCPNCGTILPQDEGESPHLQFLEQRHQQVIISPASRPLIASTNAERRCPECGTTVPKSTLPIVLIDKLVSDYHLSLSDPRTTQLVDPVSQLLPVEITAMIFELCVTHPPRPCSTHAPYLQIGYSPLHLGAVCKAWRKVAWATPRLWTFIPINLDGKIFRSEIQHKLPDGCEMTRDWLKRTGSALPLDIYVTKEGGTASDGRLEEPHCTRVMNLVNMYSSRWQHLDLYLPKYLLAKIKQGPLDSPSTPMLETLRVHTTDDLRAGPGFYRMRMKDLAPKEINIRGISYESLNIMWTNLTLVVAADLYTDEVVKMITNAPRLNFCALLDVRQRNDIHQSLPSTEPHVHRLLSTLILTSNDVGPSDLLNHITLPALSHLELKSTVETDIRFTPRITGLIHRSLPPIHTLILCLPDVSLNAIVLALHQLPFITKLILNRRFEPGLWTQFFRHIGCPCPHASGNAFLPKLQHLAFAHHDAHAPTLAGWDIILHTLQAEIANPAATFWKVTPWPHSLGMWQYNLDTVEGEDDRPAPVKIRMAARHIVGLVNVIQAGIPFSIGLRPNIGADKLDLVGLRNTLDTTNPDSVYEIEWI